MSQSRPGREVGRERPPGQPQRPLPRGPRRRWLCVRGEPRVYVPPDCLPRSSVAFSPIVGSTHESHKRRAPEQLPCACRARSVPSPAWPATPVPPAAQASWRTPVSAWSQPSPVRPARSYLLRLGATYVFVAGSDPHPDERDGVLGPTVELLVTAAVHPVPVGRSGGRQYPSAAFRGMAPSAASRVLIRLRARCARCATILSDTPSSTAASA